MAARWYGTWREDVRYVQGGMVTVEDDDGLTAVYIALAESLNVEPTEDDERWRLLSNTESVAVDLDALLESLDEVETSTGHTADELALRIGRCEMALRFMGLEVEAFDPA